MASQEDRGTPQHRGTKKGVYNAKLQQKLRLRDLAPSDASKAELLDAAIVVLHRDPPSLMRNDKEKKMRDIMASLAECDSRIDDAKVEEIAAHWLEQLEQLAVEPWEVFGAAMNFIAGNRRPHFAQKPRQKTRQDETPSRPGRGGRKRRATKIVDEASYLARELKNVDALDVILAVKMLVDKGAVAADCKDDALEYLERAIGRLRSSGATPSLRTVEVFEKIKMHLRNAEIHGWQFLRVAANKCHTKSLHYPEWARKPKERDHVDVEEAETQVVVDEEECEAEAQDTDDDDNDDEFADAFQDATIVPGERAGDIDQPSSRDDFDDAKEEVFEKRLGALEKPETLPSAEPLEDHMMTLDQMKQKLEVYRSEARRNPQVFLQKFMHLNTMICNLYEASQKKVREAAEKARRELRSPSPSPEPETATRKRRQPAVDIVNRLKRLEGNEKNRPRAAHTSVSKRTRSSNNCGVRPKTVNEAILKDLYGTAADTDASTKRAPQVPDLFDDLFGPDDEVNDDTVERQLELDLADL